MFHHFIKINGHRLKMPICPANSKVGTTSRPPSPPSKEFFKYRVRMPMLRRESRPPNVMPMLRRASRPPNANVGRGLRHPMSRRGDWSVTSHLDIGGAGCRVGGAVTSHLDIGGAGCVVEIASPRCDVRVASCTSYTGYTVVTPNRGRL